jgi:hypothetical protein
MQQRILWRVTRRTVMWIIELWDDIHQHSSSWNAGFYEGSKLFFGGIESGILWHQHSVYMGKGCCDDIYFPSGFVIQGIPVLRDTLGRPSLCTKVAVLVLLQRKRFISTVLHYYFSCQCCLLKHPVVWTPVSGFTASTETDNSHVIVFYVSYRRY